MAIQVSVIIPCYNGGKFIEAAIESVLLLNRDDIEIIIINDGSTDNTADVLKKYNDNDKVSIETITNHGAGYARNIGLQKAKGEWIAYLDADDLFIYGTDLFKRLSSIDGDTDIIYTPRAKTSFDMEREIEIIYPERKEQVANKIPRLEFWTAIYKNGFLKNNNIKFYEFREQDIETAFRYLTFSKAKKIVIDNDLFFILQRENMQSNTHTWNLHKLYRIKMLVYFDLFKQTEFEEDKEYLFGVAFDCVKKYTDHSIKNGIEKKDDHKTVIKVVKDMRRYAYPFIPKKELGRILFALRKLLIINKQISVSKTEEPQNPEITNKEAIERLKTLKLK